MPRLVWPLLNGRPVVEVVLTLNLTGTKLPRVLLADTGTGSAAASTDFILTESDCRACGRYAGTIALTGAFAGIYKLFRTTVQIPALNFDQVLLAVGVPRIGRDYDGIAGYLFLNRFNFGNFGQRDHFGIEV